MDNKLSIAIDGPAGAGKSTTAKALALRLNYKYIDTGAMYRAVTLLALEKGISMDDEKSLTGLATEVEINFAPLQKERNSVFLNEREVTEEIRTAQVNDNVSLVAKVPGVREALVEKQRKMALTGGVIMDGRDIGTVVLPNADLKIFLSASLETRAQRRMEEIHCKGESAALAEVRENLSTRDQIDSCREVGPLKKAEGAMEIDTSGLTVEEVVNKILELVEEVRHGG